MPASVAIGIKAAHLPTKSTISNKVNACTIPATGERPPFFTLVAVRAIAPVAGMPPKMEEKIFAVPCATNSILDLWLPPIIPSDTTADNRDSIDPGLLGGLPSRCLLWKKRDDIKKKRKD